MTIAIIQGSPILRCKDSYYDFNFVEFDKYLRQCDSLVYIATVKDIDDSKTKALYKVDTSKVSFRIIEKDNIRDYIHLRKRKKEIIKNAIDGADLTVVKMPSITIGKWAANYAGKINKPYIVEVCGCAWDSFWYHSFEGKILAPFNYYFTKRIISKAENVVYVTSKFLQRRYPNSKHNIGCSNVLLPEFDDEVLMQRINRIQNRKEDEVIKLGTAGALNVRYKSQDAVIKAISLLRNKGVKAEYYLAGGGSKEYLENVAKKYDVLEYIHFLGTVPKSKMYDFYDMLDIYIHPSLAEGLPRVLIEAESRALPALGANAAGTPELLSDDCVFPKKDVHAICDLVATFTTEKMEKQARDNYYRSKLYAFDVLNERRRVFYNEVINNK